VLAPFLLKVKTDGQTSLTTANDNGISSIQAGLLLDIEVRLDQLGRPCWASLRFSFRPCHDPQIELPSRMSAAFFAIAMTPALVLPRTIEGITDASANTQPFSA
jgi:hypothetical protein